MKSAGVAQQSERQVTSLEVPVQDRAPRSTFAVALAKGLRCVEADREAGYREGLAGTPYNPRGRDELSYALGFAAGGRDRGRGVAGGC